MLKKIFWKSALLGELKMSGSVKVEFQLLTASIDGSDIAWLSSAAAHSSAIGVAYEARWPI